jgi:hypothetical protein
MFEVGKQYRFVMTAVVPGYWGDGADVWTVTSVEGHLIKLSHPRLPERIVNTASWDFISAEVVDQVDATNM